VVEVLYTLYESRTVKPVEIILSGGGAEEQ
jgi:hypothetical protein